MGRMLIGWTIGAFLGSFFIVQISRHLFGGLAGGAVNTVSPAVGLVTWTAIGMKVAMKRFTELMLDLRGKSAKARDRVDSSENEYLDGK